MSFRRWKYRHNPNMAPWVPHWFDENGSLVLGEDPARSDNLEIINMKPENSEQKLRGDDDLDEIELTERQCGLGEECESCQ